jgi:hypothetical protein
MAEPYPVYGGEVLPPGELDITDIQRAIGEGVGEQGFPGIGQEDKASAEEAWRDQLSGLVESALEVGKKPEYQKGTARSWSEYSPEGSTVDAYYSEGKLAREPDGNWPPFWWAKSEQYLQDNIDENALLPVNKSELKSRYHKSLKKLRDESPKVMTRVSGTDWGKSSESAYKHVPFDQYGGPILIGFEGEKPTMPSDNDLGGADSPDFAKNKLVAKMQFEEAMYRLKLIDSQQRPFSKATGRIDPTLGPLDLIGFGLMAAKVGAKGTQELVKSFLKKGRGGQIRQPRLSGSGRMERMGERGPVTMLPVGKGTRPMPMHPDARLWSRDLTRHAHGMPSAFNFSKHRNPGFGFSDPKGYTWRPTPYPGRELVRGRPTRVGITREQYARRSKDFRQSGGFHPSGPRQYFRSPLDQPKEASLAARYLPKRDVLSKVSPQELLRRKNMFERLGYWNTAIPATLATPEIVEQMGELGEYGEALRMLEDLQYKGE